MCGSEDPRRWGRGADAFGSAMRQKEAVPGWEKQHSELLWFRQLFLLLRRGSGRGELRGAGQHGAGGVPFGFVCSCSAPRRGLQVGAEGCAWLCAARGTGRNQRHNGRGAEGSRAGVWAGGVSRAGWGRGMCDCSQRGCCCAFRCVVLWQQCYGVWAAISPCDMLCAERCPAGLLCRSSGPAAGAEHSGRSRSAVPAELCAPRVSQNRSRGGICHRRCGWVLQQAAPGRRADVQLPPVAALSPSSSSLRAGRFL